MYLQDQEGIPHARHDSYNGGGDKYSDEEQEPVQMNFNPKKLREMLELDPATKQKLSRLNK